jgi:undecaprenyl-diphosphatase
MFAFLQNINQATLIYLNSLWQYSIIQKMAIIFADAPILFLPVFFLWLWFYYNYKKDTWAKTNLLVIFYSIVVAILLSVGIQHVVYVQRPLLFLGVHAKFILSHIPDASFPSDHATVSSAFLIGILLAGYKKTFWIFLPFVCAMLLSRVIAWVHWPFDILAWIFIGSLTSVGVYKMKSTKCVTSLNAGILKIASFIRL